MAPRCGARRGCSAATTTSTFTTHQRSPWTRCATSRRRSIEAAPAVLLVGRREERAEIGQPDRAEQRVGDGVHDHVGVGMAREAGAVDRHAAEHEVAVAAERVHVESEPDPDHAPLPRQQCSRPASSPPDR